MSGPKLIEMRRRARAARIQKNRDLCDQCDAEYARLCEEHWRMSVRIAALGGDPGKPLEDPVQITSVFRDLLARGQDEEVGRRYPHQVAFARAAVEESRLALGGRLATLHSRMKRARLDAEVLAARCAALMAGAGEAEAARLAGMAVPDAHAVSEENVAELERLEADLRGLRSRLDSLESSKAPVAPPQARVPAATAGRSLADWVKQKASQPQVEGTLDAALQNRVDSVFRAAASYEDPHLWEQLRRLERALEASPRGQDADAEKNLHVLNMEAALVGARERAAFRQEILKMLDRAAVLPCPEVDREATGLRNLLASGRVEPLGPWRARMDAALEGAAAAREHEARRRAVLESLTELGYAVHEGLQTVSPQGGRLLLQKPDQGDYAVEVVADANLDRIQTAMVRFAADAEMTRDRRLQDCEEEERWCQDHARLRQKLEERGWESALVMQRPAGEHPVRVIVDADRAARQEAVRASQGRPLQRRAAPPGQNGA